MPPTKRRAVPAEGAEVDPRTARRERRRDQSREEIIEAARRVLLRSGLAATTLDAVAREVGMSKTALYYYYPSKDALLFELVFGTMEAQARAVHDAVDQAGDGAEALRAIIGETVKAFAPRMDDFRLAFLHGQVAGPGAVHVDEQQLARVRPLNELWFAGAAKKLADERRKRPGSGAGRAPAPGRASAPAPAPGRARVEPRLLAFLAYLSAIGMLTMKGMVESVDDPLVYSDDQLVEGLARVFAAAARA